MNGNVPKTAKDIHLGAGEMPESDVDFSAYNEVFFRSL